MNRLCYYVLKHWERSSEWDTVQFCPKPARLNVVPPAGASFPGASER